MKRSQTIAFAIFVIVVIASCRKEELPVQKPDSGAVTTSVVNLGTAYKKTVYFDLGTNQNVGESNKLNWDLAFSCNSDQPYITMNGGKVMLAVKITNQTFEQITSSTMLSTNGRADNATGAIQNMVIDGPGIYIIGKGMDFDGVDLGSFKMEVLEHDATKFVGRLANIDGSNEQTITLQKISEYNYVYLNWNENGAISTPIIEPLKDSWDIVFTQYTEVFYEPDYMPYLVLGVLTNRHLVQAILTTETNFETLDLAQAEALLFNENINNIGYSWKNYQFEQGMYVIDYQKTFVIKDQEGYYYKLRFIDFYDQGGNKGNPTFEFQRL